MPEYQFLARNAKGKQVGGKLRAEGPEEARQTLSERGYEVVRVSEVRGMLARLDAWLASIKPASLAEVAMTTRQLAVMVESGIPLGRALRVLNQLPLGKRLAQAWEEVSISVNQGEYLSRALGKRPDMFSMLFVGMVKAGEASGQLAANLTTVADHLEKEVMLRGKVRSAMTYPLTIFVICVVLSVLVVQHILPQFLNGLFKSSGLRLPWITRVLVAVTGFFNNPTAMAGTTVFVVVGGFMLFNFLKTPVGHYRFQQLLLHLPEVRKVLSKLLAARFCRTFGTLIQCGIPMVHALDLTNQVIGSYVISEYIEPLKARIREGGKLSEGLREIPFFPPMLATFMQLGEETGQIPHLMLRLAGVFEEDLEAALMAFTSLIEPVMIGIMGFGVGFILIAIFIPLYQIIGNF